MVAKIRYITEEERHYTNHKSDQRHSVKYKARPNCAVAEE